MVFCIYDYLVIAADAFIQSIFQIHRGAARALASDIGGSNPLPLGWELITSHYTVPLPASVYRLTSANNSQLGLELTIIFSCLI